MINAQFFTAVSTAAKVIAVSFRGSESTLEVLHEILDVVEPNVAFVGGGKVFAYFHHAFYLLWDGGLSAEIARLRQQYPDYKLVAVGHSLGASLASVFATFIASQGPWQADEVKYTGFGQPRTGDADYAAAHDRLVKYSYRLVHRKDIYAHLPPPAFGNNTFSHHRFEVWYNNNMTPGQPYQLCPRPDDFSCSNAQWNFNTGDHTHYFNRDVEGWANQGCPM